MVYPICCKRDNTLLLGVKYSIEGTKMCHYVIVEYGDKFVFQKVLFLYGSNSYTYYVSFSL